MSYAIVHVVFLCFCHLYLAIAKVILLWLTALVVLLFICSIDSIIDKSLFWSVIALAITTELVLACLIYINEDES